MLEFIEINKEDKEISIIKKNILDTIVSLANHIDPKFYQSINLKRKNELYHSNLDKKTTNEINSRILVSFVIPTYNRGKCINQSLDSLYKQKFSFPFEVIVVDDCSNDQTIAILKKYKKIYKNFFYYINSSNLKAPKTRNEGFLRANGEFIFNLDSDDVLNDYKINDFLEYMIKTKSDMALFETLLFFTEYDFRTTSAAISKSNATYLNLDDLLNKSLITFGAGNRLFRKKAWLDAGGYLELPGHDSWAMSFRMLSLGKKCVVVPKSSYFHRIWKNSFSMYSLDTLNKCHIISPIASVLESDEIFDDLSEIVQRTYNLFPDGELFLSHPRDCFRLQVISDEFLNLYHRARSLEDTDNFSGALNLYTDLINRGFCHPRVCLHAIFCSLNANNFEELIKLLNLFNKLDLSHIIANKNKMIEILDSIRNH